MIDSYADRHIYLTAVINQMPRLLGLLNRNTCSSTYGCFDRNHWHYRVVDTPAARCQEAALTLAWLYKTPGNDYFTRPIVLEWVNAALNFWMKIQRTNGSLNEWYPAENSFVATAFSTYAVSESALVLGKDALHNWSAIEESLSRAGRWLLIHRERQVMNQVSGAALALYNLFLITGDRRFESGAQEHLHELRQAQRAEGWFPEYGGADIGYSSLTVAYLAKLYRKSGWDLAREIAVPLTAFVENFPYGDGAIGGEFGSRLTEYLIPDGFEILAGVSESARNLARFARQMLVAQKGVSLYSFDDRYLSYIAYNYIEAYHYGSLLISEAPLTREAHPVNVSSLSGFQAFVESGLIHWSADKLEAVINARRGGAYKIVFAGSVTQSDGGLLFETRQGDLFYSGYWDAAAQITIADRQVLIRGKMVRVKDFPLTPLNNMLFRSFQMLAGRFEGVSLWLKNYLRTLIITPESRVRLVYEREIRVEQNAIWIKDSILPSDARPQITKLFLGSRNSFLYTPSSRFFVTSDLTERPIIIDVSPSAMTVAVMVQRQYSLDGELTDMQVVT